LLDMPTTTGSAPRWPRPGAVNAGNAPRGRVADFATRGLTCDNIDEIRTEPTADCLLVVNGNVPIDQTASLEPPKTGGSAQNRGRSTNGSLAATEPLLRGEVRSPQRVLMRGGLDKPAAKAARNAAAVVDSIALGSIVDSRGQSCPVIFRVDIHHSGAMPLPPRGNVGGDNPTAPTYEIRVNVHIHLNESMSNQDHPNELNRGGVLDHGDVVPPSGLGPHIRRDVRCDVRRDLVAAPGAEPQQAQHDDGIVVVVNGANVGGVANIAQLGQREEKGSSDFSSALTVVVGEKQHKLPKEIPGILSSLGSLLAWGLDRCFVGTGIDCKIEFPATAAGTAAAAGTGTELKVGPCYGGAGGAGDGACATRLDPSMHGNIEGKSVY
jgi:hypothetical protein